MAAALTRQEEFTSSSPLKSTGYKRQYSHDTDTLLLQAQTANKAAAVLRKQQKKIEKKRSQKKSKKLDQCIEKYNNSLMEIREAANRILETLSEGGFTDMTREGKNRGAHSVNLPKKRNRPSVQTDTFSTSPTESTSLKECMMCMNKEKKIADLEDKLKSFEQREKENKLHNYAEQGRPSKANRSSTWNEPKNRKKRDEIPDWNEECMKCCKKDITIAELEDNLKSFGKANDELHQKYEGLDQRYQDERDQRTKYQRMYKEEQEGKEDALRRLSSIASSKLRDNNPNIADLSDQFRPTKIAEKMSELYDNQWTDAYSTLEDNGLGEKQIIKSLLDMFMAAFKECSMLASENFFERVQRCIELPTEGKQPTSYKVMMPDQLKQQVKEFRKTRARFVIKEIETIVRKRIQIENQDLNAISVYLSHCIEVAWFCAVQDPPLVVRRDAPVKFDSNTYKDYTRRGKYTEFVVWPALYLHDGGALLSKGVAQGSDTTAPGSEASIASGGVSSAGYQSKNRYSSNRETASKAKHVTDIQFQKSDFDGTRTVHDRAKVSKNNTITGTSQQQQHHMTISVKPVAQASRGTAI